MVGAEALLRWQRDGGEFVPADTFIPIAEASGLLGPISEWVLREACKQRVLWSKQGVPEFPVAVNISLNEFQSEDFVPLIKSILKDTELPATLLDIELTESVIMQDRGQTKRNMELLKELGVRLSIDDFGTGYSSLSYLSHLPASVLKIDKSFVDGVAHNKNDAAIAMTIISLGNNLGMRILAEGVENEAQVDFLKKAGCHEAQGFTFSRPVKPNMIPELAIRQNYLVSTVH
jgi:EAL domain-containing protein (putative c-di-GMP-specific phosphodiesterase class I)